MSRLNANHSGARAGFSLVEVVVAVGIFAIAVIAVIGLLGPINQSVAGVRETDDASRVVGVLQAELQRAGIPTVIGFIGSTNKVYASRSGNKLGIASNAVWTTDVEDINGNGTVDNFERDAQKFFEVKITRNTTLSPSGNDNTAGYFAFNIELRWPAFTGDGVELTGDALEQQSILVVPAAITR